MEGASRAGSAYGERGDSRTDQVLSKPIIAGPALRVRRPTSSSAASTPRAEATNFAAYLRTRFVRFLVSLRKITQHATTASVYAFVPDLPMDRDWTDEMLYKKYGITKDEIAFIEQR